MSRSKQKYWHFSVYDHNNQIFGSYVWRCEDPLLLGKEIGGILISAREISKSTYSKLHKDLKKRHASSISTTSPESD